jgi:hypothetical protein
MTGIRELGHINTTTWEKNLKFSFTPEICCVDENFTFPCACVYDTCMTFPVFFLNMVAFCVNKTKNWSCFLI